MFAAAADDERTALDNLHHQQQQKDQHRDRDQKLDKGEPRDTLTVRSDGCTCVLMVGREEEGSISIGFGGVFLTTLQGGGDFD